LERRSDVEAHFWSAHWSLFEPNGAKWVSFSYNWNEQPGATLEDLPIKVGRLGFAFDGLLYHYTGYSSAGPFEQSLRKYQLLKELFRVLDCDELVGVDANAAGSLNQCDDLSERPYGGWCFRFAKTGVQVLIRALEEKRMPPAGAAPEFVFVEANQK